MPVMFYLLYWAWCNAILKEASSTDGVRLRAAVATMAIVLVTALMVPPSFSPSSSMMSMLLLPLIAGIGWIFLIVIPTARALNRLEASKQHDLLSDVVLFLLIPIGIWMLQPRVKAAVGRSR
jgi:hypothetical protein